MNTPNQQTPWSAKAAGQSKAAPGGRTAKFSIIAAVVVIGLNFAELTVFQGRSAALTAVSVAALAAVLAGLILATTGLIRAWNYPAKGAVPLAIAGLFLNGALLATGFVKTPPILGRQDAGPRKVSAKAPKEQTVTLPSGRKIITQDWTAGFVVELTDTSFNGMINDSDIPVLVDFSASWCGGLSGDVAGHRGPRERLRGQSEGLHAECGRRPRNGGEIRREVSSDNHPV